MKIALIGGHLAPALAVLEHLQKDEVFFIGRKHGLEGDDAITLEYKTIRDLEIPFFELKTGRLQRHFGRHTITSLVKFPLGVARARSILQKTQPDVVLAFGGYLSLPIAYATHMLDIPLVIHEQTLEAGFANKVISPFASAICISWESSRKHFKGKNVVLTGNPLRKEMVRPKTPDFAKDLISEAPTIYITGGSAGSHAINTLITGCLGKLLKDMIVVHQTGDARQFSDFERLSALRETMDAKSAERYILRKFIDPAEVGYVMKDADLIVSRSGINTVTELLYLAKPALFIPLPFSQRGEQQKNASFLKDQGLAESMAQHHATSDKLYDKITTMISRKKTYTIKEGGKKYREIIEEAAHSIVATAREAAED
jgi:UDP-N-acetylglucosamine--N-acetylmuramyl-(pentapeptide) pyrophosphoryl-undecaprenol N-acetylglucosamine transferase